MTKGQPRAYCQTVRWALSECSPDRVWFSEWPVCYRLELSLQSLSLSRRSFLSAPSHLIKTKINCFSASSSKTDSSKSAKQRMSSWSISSHTGQVICICCAPPSICSLGWSVRNYIVVPTTQRLKCAGMWEQTGVGVKIWQCWSLVQEKQEHKCIHTKNTPEHTCLI